MYYKITIKLPKCEDTKVIEGKGVKAITNIINEYFEQEKINPISFQDMSRIMCSSKDISKRLKILSSYFVIEKKKCKTIRLLEGEDDVYIDVIRNKHSSQCTESDK